jgi:hypothetical protein
LGTCFAAGLFLERVVIVSKFKMKKNGRDGKKTKRGSERGQAGVRAIDRARARHKIQSGR